MTETTGPPDQRGREVDGTPIPGAPESRETGVNIELGALRSRHGKQGQVRRRNATRLMVRSEGKTALTRIQPHLLRP
jgi:hypothetical protein